MVEPILMSDGKPIRYDLAPAPHVVNGLRAYLEEGRPVGSFLHALLTNDLKQAVMCADDINRGLLPLWITWLFNYAPAGSWGSPEKVEAWKKHRREELARARSESS